MGEPCTILALRELGVELVLSPDKKRLRVRDKPPSALSPEVRAAIANHHDALLKVLLFREAVTFIMHRAQEAGLSWDDPAYDEAVGAFGGDSIERLNEAWSRSDPESVKDALRACARRGVSVLPAPAAAAPPEVGAKNGRDATPRSGRPWGASPRPPWHPGPGDGDESSPQLPLEAR